MEKYKYAIVRVGSMGFWKDRSSGESMERQDSVNNSSRTKPLRYRVDVYAGV